MSGLIALLTDFGITDTYVGVMKGVMLRIAPQVQFVDLTHAVQPQNVRQAAFALLNSYRFFPPETLFLVVVDPGVGSTRKPIAARTEDYLFVAPDNGVLSYALHEAETVQVVELNNSDYHLANVSGSFHGRDIFAPGAAHLAAGVPLDKLGTLLEQLVLLPEPTLQVEGKRITGEVMHVDHFGNIITSIGLLRWGAPGRLTLNTRFGDSLSLPIPAVASVITVGKQIIYGIQRSYAEVGRGDALVLVGSSGYLELSVTQGSLAGRIGSQIGDRVEVQIG
jgi:S-adenosylmethionine hydrolase